MFKLSHGPLVLGLLVLAGCQGESQVAAFGTLERDRISLLATSTELVVQSPVSKGSLVQQGDLLLQLDDSSQKYRVAQAQAELRRLEAVLLERQNGNREEQIAAAAATVQRLQAEQQLAQQQLARQRQLRSQKLNSQADLDNAVAAHKAATAAVRSAREQWQELQHGSRSEVLLQAEAAVQAQQMVLAQEQKKLADLSIVATRRGLLEDLPYKLGERIPQGAVAAILSADEAPYARVYLPEPYLAKVQLSSVVQVQVDGLSAPLVGKVRKIASEASFTPHYALQQKDRARLVFLTEIDLTGAEKLPSGLPVQLVLP
ncbi:HlyD family efflux transporter periplasmic adaptor subunit [Rheinheimera sp.]|uniref:HlyD family secretion protein n=1 Tax=Rheinheimera sp. TaxID=1869214 RepID=UPI00307D37C7